MEQRASADGCAADLRRRTNEIMKEIILRPQRVPVTGGGADRIARPAETLLQPAPGGSGEPSGQAPVDGDTGRAPLVQPQADARRDWLPAVPLSVVDMLPMPNGREA